VPRLDRCGEGGRVEIELNLLQPSGSLGPCSASAVNSRQLLAFDSTVPTAHLAAYEQETS